MKLRKVAARFTSGLLISTMIFSLSACGEKESNDEKKETKKVEKSVDDLIKEMNEKSMSSLDIFEKAFEDECITYEEFEEALKSIPSSKADGSFDLDFTINAEKDGEKDSENMVIDCNYVTEYDNDNMSFHMGIEMDLKSTEENDNMKMDFWLINEDGTYYAYNYTSEEDITYRREIGNIKELFPEEGLTKSNLDDAFSEMDVTIDYEELTDYMNSVTDSEYMKAFKEQITLSDEYVKYNGKDHYNMTMNIDIVKLLKSLENDDYMKEMFESMEVENMDEFLSTEVSEGLTAKDILSSINYSIKYYVEPTDLYVAHMESDLKDCLNNVFDYVEDIIVDSLSTIDTEAVEGAEDAEDVSVDATVDIICNSATISYDMENNADVTVKFEGEYEEAVDEEENIDEGKDTVDEDALVVNGNTFDLYNYNNEVITTITIPDGFKVESQYSSNTYVSLYDDNYNYISVECDPIYWVEDLMNGKPYEADLEFYTKDEAKEVDSIDTNQGKVRVFLNIWSMDENPDESLFEDYVLVLDNGTDSMPSVEFNKEEIEDAGYTVESIAKTMFQ